MNFLHSGLWKRVAAVFVLAWDLAVRAAGSDLFPKPWDVLCGVVELARPPPLRQPRPVFPVVRVP